MLEKKKERRRAWYFFFKHWRVCMLLSQQQAEAEVRAPYIALLQEEGFLQQLLLRMINHRVQDFSDPLTSTLVLMATSPLQFVLCESGLLPFRTNLLPVMQYGWISPEERQRLAALVQRIPSEQLHETIETNGQYTLTVLPFTHNVSSSPSVCHLCRTQLLNAFVDLMLLRGCDTTTKEEGDAMIINSTLCNIVLQRFWSRVPTPSEVVNQIMARLPLAASYA
jgi:hypothetical protein